MTDSQRPGLIPRKVSIIYSLVLLSLGPFYRFLTSSTPNKRSRRWKSSTTEVRRMRKDTLQQRPLLDGTLMERLRFFDANGENSRSTHFGRNLNRAVCIQVKDANSRSITSVGPFTERPAFLLGQGRKFKQCSQASRAPYRAPTAGF